MLDLIPPSPGEASRRSSQEETSNRPMKRHRSSTHEPVTFEWRPPARLRRPIKQELKRQRQQRRQHQAVVQFSRRPLNTTLPKSNEPTEAKQVRRTLPGIEQHTGDMHQATSPRAYMGMPPYAGAFVRGRRTAGRKIQSVRPGVDSRQTSRPKAAKPAAKPAASLSKRVLITGERDVPFSWGETEAATGTAETKQPLYVQAPPRRFALPLHFSILPGVKNKKTQRQTVSTGKKKRFPEKLTSLF